jgi:peptidoglycan/xylan/chitin deacetylase (PgdA/CDA1 family)
MPASRLFRAIGVLSIAAALSGFVTTSAVASTASPGSGGPPVSPSEGPAGPPPLEPGGSAAAAPSLPAAAASGAAAGCTAAPYGANFYAPPFGSAKTVALTFDDGPGPSTLGIISVLRRYGLPATFFNIGQNAANRPSLVRTEATDGYLVGNHTWNHPNMATLSSSAQAAELDEATAEQESLIGWGPCAFRPPYGTYDSTTLSLAQQRGMKVWMWSVDTLDWQADGSASSYWVNRIISLAESEGGRQTHPVILMHNAPSGDPATVLALPTIIRYFASRGYTFVNLAGSTGNGYQVLTSNGGVHNFGATWYGSANGTLGSLKAVGLAVDPNTGGYWILKSNGGVAQYNAPWRGSLAGKLAAGVKVTAIAASRGGYLILTSDGAVHGFGAPTFGSAKGTLGTGTAVGLAVDAATGGYWILKSNGGVANYNAPWYGSLAGIASGTAPAIAASPQGGYLVLTSNGGVHSFDAAWYGSASGTLGSVKAVGLAVDAVTGGYWILKSNGGVANYHAPWHGSLAGIASGTAPAIAGA